MDEEFKTLIDAIHVANCAADPTSLRKDTLPILKKIFHAHSAGFLLAKSDSQTLDFNNVVVIGLDPYYLAQYPKSYYKSDPFLAALPSRKPVLTVRDLVPYHTWANLEYYKMCLRQQGIYHQMCLHLYSGTRVIGSVALHRPKETPGFNKRETTIANMLVPHLTTAIEKAQIMAQLSTEIDLHRKMNELSSTGIAVLDSELRPIYCNDKAKALCLSMLNREKGQAREAEREKPHVPSEILHDCLALKKLMQDTDQGQIDALNTTRIMYGEQEEALKITTFPTRQFSQDTSIPNFLVRIEDLSEIESTKREALKKEHHLTGRELEIVRLVSEGLTNEEISQKLYISRPTVINHLSHIFEKVRIKHRAELCKLVYGKAAECSTQQGTLSPV